MAESVLLKIGGRRLPISHPDKIFYNAGKFTKLDDAIRDFIAEVVTSPGRITRLDLFG